MAGGVKIISIAGRPRTSLRILTFVYNEIKKKWKKEKDRESQETKTRKNKTKTE